MTHLLLTLNKRFLWLYKANLLWTNLLYYNLVTFDPQQSRLENDIDILVLLIT